MIDKEKEELLANSQKMKRNFDLLFWWFRNDNPGEIFLNYLNQNNIKCVAIYGMGQVGELVYRVLKNSGIEVKYGIDQSADSIDLPLNIYYLSEELEPVDLIIVTPFWAFTTIKSLLDNKLNTHVVSIEDIVYSEI